MGAGKLRVLAGCGVAAAGVSLLASACASPAAAPAATAAAVVARAVPGVTATSVPVLGRMIFGKFPGTWDGLNALAVCEQWAGLRGQYVTRVQADTPFQLERWFSSTALTSTRAGRTARVMRPHRGQGPWGGRDASRNVVSTDHSRSDRSRQ